MIGLWQSIVYSNYDRLHYIQCSSDIKKHSYFYSIYLQFFIILIAWKHCYSCWYVTTYIIKLLLTRIIGLSCFFDDSRLTGSQWILKEEIWLDGFKIFLQSLNNLIIIQTTVNSSVICNFTRIKVSCLVFLVPKDFYLFTISIFWAW